ncbi:MAG TPA: FprA family A-type flavoprotein [Bacteroidales bacterium]|nr:FprA family A-type flavoprotein [Bacteroidales bacterium]
MNSADNRIIDITGDVKWIGVPDQDIVTFDIVMTTEFGTTYNSYFINADKKAIVEAVKDKFSDVHISKLREVTDPSEIRYIILDHTEPDHCGNTGKLLELAPDAVVVGSGNAIRYLSDILNGPFNSMVVKDGDTLDLGNKKLHFISAPNLHWPDTMFTWLEEDRVLFTCDVFGAHYCFRDIFSDFSDDYLKSFKYYFDVILKPYSRFALKAIEKISSLNIEYICTGHGPVHHENWREIVELTRDYAARYLQATAVREVKNIFIAYISAYGYTKQIAEEIAAGMMQNPSVRVTIRDIENMPLGEMESEVVMADAILVGSPTINQNTLLPVYKLFSVINPLRDNSKLAGSFGSYGWSGEAPRIISESLRNLKLRVFVDSAAIKFYPGMEEKEALRDYGKRFADFLIAECGNK